MGSLVRNFRYGLRGLGKSPGLTAAVIATLMLGIGATTAIYTVVYAVLLAPLPYPSPEQLVMVWSKVHGHNNGISAGDFLDWKEQSRSFQQIAAWTGGSFNLSANAQPEQVDGMRPTPGWFSMQGIPFLMGRDFVPEEGIPGKDHAVILTYKLWNRLGASRNVIGQAMRINGEPYMVVGVLAPGIADRFDFQLSVPLVSAGADQPRLSLASRHGAFEARRDLTAGASRYEWGNGTYCGGVSQFEHGVGRLDRSAQE